MAYPNFLGIGAQKSATSWLHWCLSRHPDVYLPPMKEVHYFDGSKVWSRSKGPFRKAVKRRDLTAMWWLFKYACVYPKNDAWYGSLFPRNGYKVVGEITPAYSALRDAQVRHVNVLMPSAKIIFIMRNPVDRVWSAVRWWFGTKLDKDLESVSTQDILEFVDRVSTVQRTSYLDTMDLWERYYPREQILYKYYEDIRKDPERFLKSVCDFLAIDYDRFTIQDFARPRGRSQRLAMPEEVRHHIQDKYGGMVHRMVERGCEVPEAWLAAAGSGARP